MATPGCVPKESSGFAGLLGCSNIAKKAGSSSPVGSLDLVSRMLFPTPASSYTVDDFPGELIWVPKSMNPQTCRPEECVPCIFLLSPSARFLILYLHSNAEDLGQCYSFCTLLRHQFQVHVLAVEYPGYGVCPGGQADEESVTENCITAFRFIREVLCWPLDGILILGRSIGTGPALAIATKYEVYGVVLVSPFLSVQEVVKGLLGPIAYLMADRFPNKDCMHRLRSALLIVHGKKDIVVPAWHGEQLYHACKTRKRLVCPDAMHHNSNLYTDPNFFVLPMLQFFALPDFCFEDPKVPHWAFDKRLSTHHTPGIPVQPQNCSWRTKDESTNVVVVGKPVSRKSSYDQEDRPATWKLMQKPGTSESPGEDINRRLRADGRFSEGLRLQPALEDLDVLPPAVEDATSAAVARFLSRNGLAALPGQSDRSSRARGDIEEASCSEEELPDLPEPACEGVFTKVPLSRSSCPTWSETDREGNNIDLTCQPLLISI